MAAERKHAPARVAIRVLTADDDAFVERMMLLAGFPPHIDLPRDARQMDHVRRFLDGWGRADDVGVVAVDEQRRRLGAAWARTFSPPPTVAGEAHEELLDAATRAARLCDGHSDMTAVSAHLLACGRR